MNPGKANKCDVVLFPDDWTLLFINTHALSICILLKIEWALPVAIKNYRSYLNEATNSIWNWFNLMDDSVDFYLLLTVVEVIHGDKLQINRDAHLMLLLKSQFE